MGDTTPDSFNPGQLGDFARLFHLQPGDRFQTERNTYVLDQSIGEGGMAVVWRAHAPDGTPFALKFLRHFGGSDGDYKRRLQKESVLANEMDHPNVVRVLEFVDDPKLSYVVMEYVDGGDLYSYMQTSAGILPIDDRFDQLHRDGNIPVRGVPVDQALIILRAIADIYVRATLAGKRIVHRDLKPENILLDRNGNPKLSDFGIAKDLDASSHLTRTGVTPGTFLYMAPERILDSDGISVQSDMYSLGVIAYYMLTGRPPFYAEDAQAVLTMHCEQSPIPAHSINSGIPLQVSQVLSCLLAKEQDARFSPAGLIAALARIERGLEPEYPPLYLEIGGARRIRPVQSNPDFFKQNGLVLLLLGVLILVVLGGVVAVYMITHSPNPEVPTERVR